MTEENESRPQEINIGDELRALGDNLIATLREAWGSPERQQLQSEIETGLADLGSSLKKAAADFETSPTGQRLKADLDDFGERVRSGEVESKLRSELLEALRAVNLELEKAAARMEKTPVAPQENNDP
jgi:hypothetical protein